MRSATDFVLSGEIPWSDVRLANAKTLHLGGSREHLARGARCRRRTSRGMTDVDGGVAASRRPGSHRRAGTPAPVDLLAHAVGFVLNQTETLTAFSSASRPAFATSWWRPPRRPDGAHNANLVGGDIGVGGNTLWHALAGPTRRLNPWTTPLDGVHLYSSATPGRRRARHGRLLRGPNRAAARIRHQDVPKLSP